MGLLSRFGIGRGDPPVRSAGEAQQRALWQVLEGDLDAAEEGLRRALQRESRAIEAYLALGLLYRQRGEHGRCIQLHQNLLLRGDLEPAQRRRALLDLARDFEAAGFQQRGIAAFEEVLAHEPRNAEALAALVRLHEGAGDHPRAIALERRRGRLRGRDRAEEARLWTSAARSAHAEGRHDDARAAVRRALRRDGHCGEALVLLGQLEAERGHARNALHAWREVPRVAPELAAGVYPRLAATYAALDRAQEFEGFLRELLAQRPDDADARLALARQLASRGERDGAETEVRRILAAEPRHWHARAFLGSLLLAPEVAPERVAAEYAELLALLDDEKADGP